MSFPRRDEIDKAVALLKTLVPRQILASVRSPTNTEASPQSRDAQEPGEPQGPPKPLMSLTLKGLHSIQSASKASVLYAVPQDEDGTFFKFCEKLKTIFQEAGLMTNEDRPLLLHATILNTIYVKGRNRAKRHEKLTVDARGILDRYEDFVWMEEVALEKIAICRMGAK
jgi:activating signal cointegrator complex subunit 1